MSEYIEKGALMSLIESEAHRWGDDYDWWQCLADVEDFKPADVRPVVRGRWVRKNTDGSWRVDVCSCCKKEMHYINYAPAYNYCPNCGADLREVEP